MKKSITNFALTLLVALSFGLSASAQWNVHEGGEERRSATANEVPPNIEIGHCSVLDPIYEYTGLSLSYDSRVGAGVVFPRDMFEDYIGGVIIGMYVGWDDHSTAEYDCFVSAEGFGGKTITAATTTVGFGWNAVEMKQALVPDADYLYVGFYTDLKKDVCSLPYLYPYNTPNTVFLHSGETDQDGKEIWYDMHTMPGMGQMAIILVVMDRNGKFANIARMSNFRANTITWKEDLANAQFRIKNSGSNPIESIEIETKFGDMTMSDVYNLAEPIAPNDYRNVAFPVYCLGTGTHDFTITKVNGEDNKRVATVQFDFLAVPWELEGKYDHLPLIEYFVSEESYMYPRYFDEMFVPGFIPYQNDFNVVFQHLDDKFMFGDNEALLEMLSLANNDSSMIFVPAFTVNRSDYIEYLAPLVNTPFHNGTPFPEAAPPMWEGLRVLPTFASVDIAAKFDNALSNVTIDVTGNIAADVMPADEPLYLTVYLMEKNVYSEDQVFWDDKDKENHYGGYTHQNVVRDILTPYWGEQLSQNSGDYNGSFSVELDPEWNVNNLYVVAFLNRGVENNHMSRQVINSNLAKINWPEAVYGIEDDQDVVITTLDGSVYVNGSVAGVEVYNLAGARLNNAGLTDGIYLIRKDNIVAKVMVK